jgi:WD40 repeat protein
MEEKGNFDIWDIATGKLMYKYHGSTPFSIDGVNGSLVFWSPNGKYLAMIAGKTASIGDGMLSIWRIP